MKTPIIAALLFVHTASNAFQLQSVVTKGLSALKGNCQNGQNDGDFLQSSNRRDLLLSMPILAAIGFPQPVKAEWVRFPATKGLGNKYHFMRAGQSLLEEANILATNPMFLTNRDNALSSAGREQVQEACRIMEVQGINPSVVKFSLAANAMDTADIVAMQLNVGRNRLVPEYTYMDQRGAGKWDMLPLQTTQEAIWAMDVKEAGPDGLGGRPPAHDDGTPNETISNQVTRLRQLISLLESSLSGDEILLIFPDATGPAILSALIAGMPLNRVHEIAYEPGELRIDVNYDTVRANWPEFLEEEYTATIARGESQLKTLRSIDPSQILNVREQEYNQEILKAKQEATKMETQKALAREEEAKMKSHKQKEYQLQMREKQLREAEKESERTLNRAKNSVSQGPLDFASFMVLGIASAMVAWKDKDREGSKFDEEIRVRNDTSTSLRIADQSTIVSDLDPDQTLAPIQSEDSYSGLLRSNHLAAVAPIDLENILVSPERPASENGKSKYEELDEMERKIKVAPIEIPEYKTSSQIKAERLELAQQAMDKYMSSDDGGDAWLEIMSELARKEDDGRGA